MSGPQKPTPVRPQGQAPAQDAKKNPLAYVLTRWVDFDTKAKAGTLGADHAKSVRTSCHLLWVDTNLQIRTIITQQPRAAILQGLLTLKYNIFKDMAEILDPRLEHGGPPALTMEQFIRENALALEDLKTLSMRTRLAANQSAGSGASTSGSQQGSSPVGTPQPQPVSHPQLQTGNGTNSAPTTAPPRPPMNATAPQGVGRPPIRPAPMPPIPEGLLALPDVRKILSIGNLAQRAELLDKVG